MISDQSTPVHPGAPLEPEPRELHRVAVRALVAASIVALLLLVAYLHSVIVLIFGSVLVAVAVRTGSQALRRHVGLSDRAALATVEVGTLVLLVGGVWLLGDPISDQFAALRSALPAALDATTRWLNSHVVGLWLLRWWEGANPGVEWTKLAGLFGNAMGALAGGLLMIVIGLYLAADPDLYRRGLLQLVPRRQRPALAHALGEAGNGLSRWLLGQAVAMLLVGLLTGVGLALIGMPLAMPLGIVAGILEFVPFFGPIVSGALTVLLAFTQGAPQAAYAALVCFVVQHVEGYLIQPFVQRWAIALPPALGLISVIVFGLLFGALGVVFALPLMVVLMVLVRCLYIEEGLGKPAATSGAQEPRLPIQTPPAGAVAAVGQPTTRKPQ